MYYLLKTSWPLIYPKFDSSSRARILCTFSLSKIVKRRWIVNSFCWTYLWCASFAQMRRLAPWQSPFKIWISGWTPQIREQMSGLDLHLFRLKVLALKKLVFPQWKYFPNFFWLLFTFTLCNFSVRTLKYFQKTFKLIFCP